VAVLQPPSGPHEQVFCPRVCESQSILFLSWR